MATFPHLPLERLERNVDRRRVPSPVGPPQRSAPAHAARIQTKIDNAVTEQSAVPQSDAIDRAPRGRELSVREDLTRIIVDWSGSWQATRPGNWLGRSPATKAALGC